MKRYKKCGFDLVVISQNEKVLFYNKQRVIEVVDGKKRYYYDNSGKIHNRIVDRSSSKQNEFLAWDSKKKKLPSTRIKKLKTMLENKNETEIDPDDFIQH